MLSGMEDHKDDVSNMHKAADEVIDLIGNETPMANNIKSQVADIHDCWNNTVRQVIEAISKVSTSCYYFIDAQYFPTFCSIPDLHRAKSLHLN